MSGGQNTTNLIPQNGLDRYGVRWQFDPNFIQRHVEPGEDISKWTVDYTLKSRFGGHLPQRVCKRAVIPPRWQEQYRSTSGGKNRTSFVTQDTNFGNLPYKTRKQSALPLPSDQRNRLDVSPSQYTRVPLGYTGQLNPFTEGDPRYVQFEENQKLAQQQEKILQEQSGGKNRTSMLTQDSDFGNLPHKTRKRREEQIIPEQYDSAPPQDAEQMGVLRSHTQYYSEIVRVLITKDIKSSADYS